MKPEYQRIVLDCLKLRQSNWITDSTELANEVAKRCEALANKPVRELTDAEIREHYRKFAADFEREPGDWDDPVSYWYGAIRAVIAAHIAKQSEPEEIPFSQEKLDEGGWMVKIYHDPVPNESTFFTKATKVTLVRKP